VSRILIIASYSGPRRWSLPSGRLLQAQHDQLSKLRHKLDKIVVVQNESKIVPKELGLFEHVIHRPNKSGSYGAWLDGYTQNPDHDWYFFIEDDYLFVHDDFDDMMIDLWDDTVSYLCSRVDPNNKSYGYHMAVTNGLTHRTVLEGIGLLGAKFRGLDDIYNTQLQIAFSRLFELLPGRSIRSMQETYCMPFWQEELRFVDARPKLIVPAQMVIA